MKARLVVFPVRGRNWCFSRSIIDRSESSQSSSSPPSRSVKDLWNQIYSNNKPFAQNAEILVDFVADKMNQAWSVLEKAPEKSFKNKLHGLGLMLLARVKPSEVFLKSISNDITQVEVTYPTSLNPRLVRRRLRHIAIRGTVIHKRYFYGSVSVLPMTSALAVLPLPNVPFFWVLFRTYSHWRALKGSEKLLLLATNSSHPWKSSESSGDEKETSDEVLELESRDSPRCELVMKPSKELDKLVGAANGNGLSKLALSKICEAYHLDTTDVLKYLKAV